MTSFIQFSDTEEFIGVISKPVGLLGSTLRVIYTFFEEKTVIKVTPQSILNSILNLIVGLL